MSDEITGPVSGPVSNNSESKPAKVDKPDKSLYRILICGDFGGKAKHKVKTYFDDDGIEREVEAGDDSHGREAYEAIVEAPCQNPSSFGIPGSQYGITPGPCYKHTKATLDLVARKKAIFLDAYMEAPELGIQAAAQRANMSRMNVYWWREHDPDFRESMLALVGLAEAIMTDQVEEYALDAIKNWRPGAARLVEWWLVNKRGDKWKSLGKADGDNGGGITPKFQGGQHVHVWKRGDKYDQFPGG
jgi:hypothetical protein